MVLFYKKQVPVDARNHITSKEREPKQCGYGPWNQNSVELQGGYRVEGGGGDPFLLSVV